MDLWPPLQKYQPWRARAGELVCDVLGIGKGAGYLRALVFADGFGLFDNLSNSRPVDDRTSKFPCHSPILVEKWFP